MAEQHFNPFTNERESFFPPDGPGAPTVYRRTLSDGQTAGALTEEEIAEALEGLAEQGYVRGESVYPGFEAQWIPTVSPSVKRTFTEEEIARIADADGDAPAPSLMRVSITDRLLRAIDELGAATEEYGAALDRHAAATIAAYESAETLAYGELDLRAKCYAETVPGKNEAERKVNLDLAAMDDGTLSDLRAIDDQCRHERTLAEAHARKLDQLQKSLRDQIKGITALLHR